MSGEIANKVISYVRPREKALAKGVGSLSDSELLQLVIGSGTLQFNVVKIARRLSRLLGEYHGHITAELLKDIPGLGPAKISQLLAIFELGARYPTRKYSIQLAVQDEIARYSRTLLPSAISLWIITLDGSRHVIEKRMVVNQSVKATVRELCVSLIKDNAEHVVCVRHTKDDMITPTMDDLSMARDIRQLVHTLGVSSVEYLIVNPGQHYSVMKEVAHAK